jgi:hypothetical protein
LQIAALREGEIVGRHEGNGQACLGWRLARPRNRIASRRITTKLGEASFKAPTFATSDGVSVGVGFMQREAATLRETYGEGFARGVRSDMKLDTLLDQTGAKSLSQLVKKR